MIYLYYYYHCTYIKGFQNFGGFITYFSDRNNNQEIFIDQKMNEKENSPPKLVYYKIRGLGQPIRHLLYYMDIKFEDTKLQRDLSESSEQLQSTFNSGLPKFQDQQITISDCVAIPIYICQKYNFQTLIGYTPRSRAKINQVMFKYWMEKKKMMPSIIEIVLVSASEKQNENQNKQMLIKMISESKFLSYCLKNHKKTKKWVLQNLSIIDFFFYDICYYITNFFKDTISNDGFLSGILTFTNQFQKLQFFKKQQKEINQIKLFFPFLNQVHQKKVKVAWKGKENIQII